MSNQKRYSCSVCFDHRAKESGGICSRCLEERALEAKTDVFASRTKFNGKVNASQFIEQVCDGNDYGVGALEATTANARKTSEVVANLIRVLFENGVLSKEEVENIGSVY